MRWRFFASEAMQSVRNNVATTIAASVTVLIVTLLLGAFAYVSLVVRDQTQSVKDQVTVKAYLPMGMQDENTALDKVHNELAQIPGVKQITYVSPDAAKSQLSEEEQKQIDVLGYNPLPPAFELKLTDANKFEDVSAAALKVDEVRACGNDPCVTNGADKTKRVLHWVRVIQLVLLALMVLLGIAAIVLIANTIRLSIFSRRREIEVMKLVGATNWFVRVPFMLEGMLTGFVGSVAGVILLGIAYTTLGGLNHDLTSPAALYPGGVWALGLTLAAFGLLLGAFGSGMTLRRFLRV
jgi:cell division transport system permease protein